MAVAVIQFSVPRELPSTFDGRYFRVPYSVVDREYFGSPRESANTRCSHVNVRVSGTTLATWHLDEVALAKAVSQVAKEHVEQRAAAGANLGEESTVPTVQSGPCPYEIAKIEMPPAAFVVNVHRPIGFVGGA